MDHENTNYIDVVAPPPPCSISCHLLLKFFRVGSTDVLSSFFIVIIKLLSAVIEETFASESLENLLEIFPWYYTHTDPLNGVVRILCVLQCFAILNEYMNERMNE